MWMTLILKSDLRIIIGIEKSVILMNFESSDSFADFFNNFYINFQLRNPFSKSLRPYLRHNFNSIQKVIYEPLYLNSRLISNISVYN